ncbi:MAG: hypothetical protein SPI18_02995 [Prevotella sp.]|nr:hypothetical protein [Prevotella sp.]MDY6130243.1 hypothetical protein [Prevotella sp.]
MMKQKITLFALVALTLGSTKAVAQNEPPKVSYQCDFENASKPDYNDEVLVINGKRWRFHSARIVSDSLRGIPQGRKAVELLAGEPGKEPACIEMLDTVKGRSLVFSVFHSGMDRIINRNGEAWRLEVTFDNGKTWAYQSLNFDTNDIPVRFVGDVPSYGQPYRFRISFFDDGDEGADWRILVDDFMVMHGDDYAIPWSIHPGHIGNGFCTAENSLTFKPILSGSTFWFGPKDWDYPNTYIELTLDDNEPVQYYEMPLDIEFTLNDLSEGKHHVNMRFMKRPDMTLWEDARQTDFDFYVKPITPIKGIKALRKAKVGEFYELMPDGDNTIYVNWQKRSRAQKWLFDGKSGIWVDDPRYLDYQRDLPDRMLAVKSMRGQLVEIDNNLVFRLDRRPQIEEMSDDVFRFQNYMCGDLSVLESDYEAYAGFPLSLIDVTFAKPFGQIDPNPNGRIEVVDAKGNRFILQNIYSDDFQKKNFPVTGPMAIFGMVGRTFIDNKPCLFPLAAISYEPSGIDATTGGGNGMRVWNADGNVYLSSMRKAEVAIYDIGGRAVERAFLGNGESLLLNMAKGVFVAVAKYADGTSETVKFVK